MLLGARVIRTILASYTYLALARGTGTRGGSKPRDNTQVDPGVSTCIIFVALVGQISTHNCPRRRDIEIGALLHELFLV